MSTTRRKFTCKLRYNYYQVFYNISALIIFIRGDMYDTFMHYEAWHIQAVYLILQSKMCITYIKMLTEIQYV